MYLNVRLLTYCCGIPGQYNNGLQLVIKHDIFPIWMSRSLSLLVVYAPTERAEQVPSFQTDICDQVNPEGDVEYWRSCFISKINTHLVSRATDFVVFVNDCLPGFYQPRKSWSQCWQAPLSASWYWSRFGSIPRHTWGTLWLTGSNPVLFLVNRWRKIALIFLASCMSFYWLKFKVKNIYPYSRPAIDESSNTQHIYVNTGVCFWEHLWRI